MKFSNEQKRQKRHRRIRVKVKGTVAMPRLSLYRGTRTLIAQLIDDEAGKTLHYFIDRTKSKKSTQTPVVRAAALGKQVGETLKEKGIMAVVFDRGGWRYHGRVKAFADSVRESGIKF